MIAIRNSELKMEDVDEKTIPLNIQMLMNKPNSIIAEMGKQLLQAAKTGSTEKVHELMSRGAPFTTDWLGTSPLHLAARFNHYDTCQVLLRAGISKDSKTKVDRTPLHFAVYEGNETIVQLLLNSKVDVEARDMLKMTALHWAVQRGHDKIVEMLLQHGANPDVTSKFGKTPISIASERGFVDVVRILLLAANLRKQNPTTKITQIVTKPVNEQNISKNVKNEEDHITMDLSNDDDISESSDNLVIDRDESLSEAIINLGTVTDENSDLDSNALQMLKEHGISMIPSDDSGTSLINSVLQSGRKIVLSEAGKFALNETKLVKKGSTQSSTTIKIIKKGPSSQQLNLNHKNKVIKVLSAEEFKQMCRNGEESSSGFKSKSTPTVIQSSVIPLNANTNVRKVMTTKYPSSMSSGQNVVQNRFPSVSSDVVKRIRTSTGVYEILQKSPSPALLHRPTLGSFSELEKQFHELKKQTDELRKQFEISQKQNEDYRTRLDKLEKEVRLLTENNSIEESEMMD